MSKLMISVSGIRGIFGESLTPGIALNFAAHFGLFCGKGEIVVGRDSRTTGPAMLNAIISGLLSVGCNVRDLGIVSTPTVLLAVEESDASGGISITASHNAAEWNAMKLVDSNGMFLFPKRAEKFLSTLEEPIPYADWQTIGILSYDDKASQRHIKKILEIPYINLNQIRKRKFKVVLDSVNGAGGNISPLLLRSLGCEVIEINSETNGHFAHIPEPLAKNLKEIEAKVKETGADIGFATDPDVDRLAIISEQGICIGEENSLLLVEKFILGKTKGDIVTNLSSSMASEDIAEMMGVSVQRTKVGEINVGKLMMELKSPIGGEGNGGIICPEVHYTRDAPAGMALILAFMAERHEKVSTLVAEIPQYHFAKDKIKVAPEQLDKVMANAETKFNDLPQDRTDGIKVLGDKYWIHIRKSGTEPIVRVYVESETPERSSELCQQTIEKLMDGID